MSANNDGSRIVIILQPKGEPETRDLAGRLGKLVELDPATATSGMNEILSDGDLDRVLWATCEISDFDGFAAYEAIATTLEKLLSLSPTRRGRLQAMLMIDDPDSVDEVTINVGPQRHDGPLN